MLNGDVISFFSYTQMLEQHKETNAMATISAIRVPDVSRYGVLVSDNDSNVIRDFYEKPRTTELIKKYSIYPVNAGTYLLEPAVFDFMEPDKKVSIEKDVFPKIARQGVAYKFEFSGIWKDFGLPEEYLAGNFIILDEETKRLGVENIIHESVEIGEGTTINPPVCFDSGVKIGTNCSIGPNVILGSDVQIGNDGTISESVFLEHCYVENNSVLKTRFR